MTKTLPVNNKLKTGEKAFLRFEIITLMQKSLSKMMTPKKIESNVFKSKPNNTFKKQLMPTINAN